MKVLAINSLPAVGVAGLKSVLPILQELVIPVPSLLLTGLGNRSGHHRMEYEFETNLLGTFQHLLEQEERVVLYVGYLSNAAQVDIIANAIDRYYWLIESVIIDPVCGDNGIAYVTEDLIKRWKVLLGVADWALPNATEAALLIEGEYDSLEANIAMLRYKFTKPQWIVTSIIADNQIVNRLISRDKTLDFSNSRLPINLSGTGDAFASYFILGHYFLGFDADQAITFAAKQVEQAIQRTIQAHSKELIFSDWPILPTSVTSN